MRPVLEAVHFVSYNLMQGARRLMEFPHLSRDNEILKIELQSLRQKMVDIREIDGENKRLKTMLNFMKTINFDHISARVIGRDVSPWSNWMIVNVGFSDGVNKDMPIVAHGGLVGKIVSVANDVSQCILIIDRQSKVSAMIQESRDTGIIEGIGDGFLSMRYLSLTSDISIGDTIVTSGLGGVYPKGLAIGTISVIGNDKSGLHLFSKIKPFVDFSKLEEVVCLRKSNLD